MPVKKSELYSSLWAACDALRGGMDASQYKDYVLGMLFLKYVSDKYAGGGPYAAINVPLGASFDDMRALKGKANIGEALNVNVVQALIEANPNLSRSDFPNFNDPAKLGEGKEMVDRLTGLIAIFERPELDFSSNRADQDDLLGDAYEYLMRHFASESGKSKGQFYTPAEVSLIMAKVIGIDTAQVTGKTTAYDPTCGSGSLLLKVASEAGTSITLYGQEKDVSTAGLARMNMILHGQPAAKIEQGNTLANPKFKDGPTTLKTFDFVVANPPFSDKAWLNGVDPEKDTFGRFSWGTPPNKQGDYAYLMHIIRSLKQTGKGACILPHGVLFRGNAEAVLRKQLVDSGILVGIIGLPANLFYGTGIPACILVLDKDNAQSRRGIYMIDASKGYIKDGPKNKLRDQDVHRIVDTFSRRESRSTAGKQEVSRYARMVPHEEISGEKNDYNLNLPRYIDATEPEDRQDLNAHLRGGIPARDVDAMSAYWDVLPTVRRTLFRPSNWEGYVELVSDEVRAAILEHEEFVSFRQNTQATFNAWAEQERPRLHAFNTGERPKQLIAELSESLLSAFAKTPLLPHYDLYQHLMDFWEETMQDDAYLIAGDGWVEPTKPKAIVAVKVKKGETKPKPDTPDFTVGKTKYRAELVPSRLVIGRYFTEEQAAIDALEAEIASIQQQTEELEEEHSGEDGLLEDARLDSGKLSKASVAARRKVARTEADSEEEVAVLDQYLAFAAQEADAKKKVKAAEEAMYKAVLARYETLTEGEIKTLVIEDKWLAKLRSSLRSELERISQQLTTRIRELSDRYAEPLPTLTSEVETLSTKVNAHLEKMGMSWN